MREVLGQRSEMGEALGQMKEALGEMWEALGQMEVLGGDTMMVENNVGAKMLRAT